jgi:hypothetical protein
MPSSSDQENSPLTFDLNDDLLAKLDDVCARTSAATKSEVIRYAITVFDFGAFKPDVRGHRQISVRLAPKQKTSLIKLARVKGVSIGELLRVALDALPANPAGLGTKTKTEAMPKKAKKKKAKKK